MALDHFCQFTREDSRFRLFAVGKGGGLIWEDEPFSDRKWTEGKGCPLAIQASVAQE